MNASFWCGKKVFVTGHTGFKGSWLCLWLQQVGADVTGYALNPPTVPSLFEIANVSQGMTSIIGDVRDGPKLTNALRHAQPDIVIHMAAQPLVRYSYTNPVETFETNVLGTVNLLEALRTSASVRAAVMVTTDKCYENREWVWGYRENEPLGGYDPYSSSKACAELVTSAYRNSFFHSSRYDEHKLALASARAGNVIGGGDWAMDRLIPDILRAITQGETVYIRNPHAIRPWQHVMEPLSGYLHLAECLYSDGIQYAEAWNFGPIDTDAKPVEWIVERLCAAWGNGACWQLDNQSSSHEANFLRLDCSKSRSILGWMPVWSLDFSIDKIIEWHKGLIQDKNMRTLTLSQIKEYENHSLRTL